MEEKTTRISMFYLGMPFLLSLFLFGVLLVVFLKLLDITTAAPVVFNCENGEEHQAKKVADENSDI